MSVGLSLRTGGGDLDAGGSSGRAFAAYIPLGAFKLVNSLIFHSTRDVHALLQHLLRCWCSQQLELSSSPLISTGSHRAEEAQLTIREITVCSW